MKKNNFKSLMQAAVLICTPLVIASCDDVFGDVDNPIPSHLTVSQADVNLELHAAHPEKATFIRKAFAATGAQLVYSSSNEKIATVDANGKITAVGEGDCKITVKATGLDSNGKQTYQEAEESFTVNVKDYRARIELIEGAEIPVFNSADASLAEIDLSKVIKVWPANVNIDFEEVGTSGVINIVKDGKTGQESIKLKGASGTAKVTAAIDPTEAIVNKKLFETYEKESFKDNQKTGEFEITVKEGVAYIAGYDAKGAEIRKTMFMNFNGEKVTALHDVFYKNTGTADNPKWTLIDNDVTLEAGWYYLDAPYTFAHNIRVKGDVNIILGGYTLDLAKNSKDIMDESAKQNYKLNFYKEEKADPTVKIRSIKDFKEVNICGVTITSPVDAVENVTVLKGTIGALTGTGAVDITNGTVGQVSGFATVAINKGLKGLAASNVTGMDNITTATIAEGATVGNMNDITTLTIDEATSIGNVFDTETVSITKTPIKILSGITNLTLNEISTTASSKLNKIGTATINKTNGTATFDGDKTYPSVTVNALTISDGTVVVNTDIKGFKKVTGGWDDQDTKVTMTGGKLTVNGPSGTVFAILGDVEVSGELATGDFYAVSPDHHAVSGALTGKFEGCSDNKSWKAITGAERPKYIRNKASE